MFPRVNRKQHSKCVRNIVVDRADLAETSVIQDDKPLFYHIQKPPNTVVGMRIRGGQQKGALNKLKEIDVLKESPDKQVKKAKIQPVEETKRDNKRDELTLSESRNNILTNENLVHEKSKSEIPKVSDPIKYSYYPPIQLQPQDDDDETTNNANHPVAKGLFAEDPCRLYKKQLRNQVAAVKEWCPSSLNTSYANPVNIQDLPSSKFAERACTVPGNKRLRTLEIGYADTTPRNLQSSFIKEEGNTEGNSKQQIKFWSSKQIEIDGEKAIAKRRRVRNVVQLAEIALSTKNYQGRAARKAGNSENIGVTKEIKEVAPELTLIKKREDMQANKRKHPSKNGIEDGMPKNKKIHLTADESSKTVEFTKKVVAKATCKKGRDLDMEEEDYSPADNANSKNNEFAGKFVTTTTRKTRGDPNIQGQDHSKNEVHKKGMPKNIVDYSATDGANFKMTEFTEKVVSKTDIKKHRDAKNQNQGDSSKESHAKGMPKNTVDQSVQTDANSKIEFAKKSLPRATARKRRRDLNIQNLNELCKEGQDKTMAKNTEDNCAASDEHFQITNLTEKVASKTTSKKHRNVNFQNQDNLCKEDDKKGVSKKPVDQSDVDDSVSKIIEFTKKFAPKSTSRMRRRGLSIKNLKGHEKGVSKNVVNEFAAEGTNFSTIDIAKKVEQVVPETGFLKEHADNSINRDVPYTKGNAKGTGVRRKQKLTMKSMKKRPLAVAVEIEEPSKEDADSKKVETDHYKVGVKPQTNVANTSRTTWERKEAPLNIKNPQKEPQPEDFVGAVINKKPKCSSKPAGRIVKKKERRTVKQDFVLKNKLMIQKLEASRKHNSQDEICKEGVAKKATETAERTAADKVAAVAACARKPTTNFILANKMKVQDVETSVRIKLYEQAVKKHFERNILEPMEEGLPRKQKELNNQIMRMHSDTVDFLLRLENFGATG